MPSEVVASAFIVGGLIGASIWWAQRDRTITADVHLGRKEDELMSTAALR